MEACHGEYVSWLPIYTQDLGPIQAADPRIRGVLGENGENFLAHFDHVIDYADKLLCLDKPAVSTDPRMLLMLSARCWSC